MKNPFENNILLIVKRVVCVFFLVLNSPFLFGQSIPDQVDIKQKKKEVMSSKTGNKKSTNQLSSNARNAQEKYNTDERSTAQSFVNIADELAAKGEYERAESFYNRAVTVYKQLNSNDDLSVVQRKLAKVQEELNKTKEAIINYSNAATNNSDELSRGLNMNDLKRVRSADLDIKENYAKKNVEMLSKVQNNMPEVKVEMADALGQLATSQRLQNKQEDALKNLSKAIAIDGQHKVNAEKEVEELSNALVKDNKIDDAISFQKIILNAADSAKNDLLKINALSKLGTLYAQTNQKDSAEHNLLKAYELANDLHLTKTSKEVLKELLMFYNKTGQVQKSQKVSADFLDNLDQMLANDSSLLDMKAFEEIESRIQILEQEKSLQATIISQTKRNNYLLIAVAAIVLISLSFIAKAYYTILKRNKKIRLQSLRREMNPHFVFNSLNSVNQFIAQNDEIKANKYLSSYSTLMRTIMEHSSKDFVPLAVEMDHLEKYLNLEYQRFSHLFTYEIKVDEGLDKMETFVPNMIIQPFLENAVWHGLRYRKTIGLLVLNISKNEQALFINITDNGIGIEQSKALKTKNQKQHKSLGMNNTLERIALLNQLYKTKITCKIVDLSQEGGEGTAVQISLPLQKHNYEIEYH